MKFYLILLLLINPFLLIAQSFIHETERLDSLSIQYINIQENSILMEEINQYIREKLDSVDLFRLGFGYITIGGLNQKPLPTYIVVDSFPLLNKELAISFTIGLSSSMLVVDSISTSFGSKSFPLYYTFVENRLVLIYDSDAKWYNQNKYSKNSERKVASLIENALSKVFSPNFEFINFRKQKYVLSEFERKSLSRIQILQHAAFTLNTSKTVYIFSDGSKTYHSYHSK